LNAGNTLVPEIHWGCDEPIVLKSKQATNFLGKPGVVRSDTIKNGPKRHGSRKRKYKVKEYENDQYQYQYGLQHGGV